MFERYVRVRIQRAQESVDIESRRQNDWKEAPEKALEDLNEIMVDPHKLTMEEATRVSAAMLEGFSKELSLWTDTLKHLRAGEYRSCVEVLNREIEGREERARELRETQGRDRFLALEVADAFEESSAQSTEDLRSFINKLEKHTKE